MKLAVLMALVVSTTVACAAQTISLECGYVGLRLGEPEKEAAQALTDAGYSLVETGRNPNYTCFSTKAPKIHDSCDVAFTKGRLTYAARRWEKNISSDLDAMHNVVAAIQ